jgi:hypothetical protein
MPRVFSIERFKADGNITKRKMHKALRSRWPQECDGKPVIELAINQGYMILQKWTEEKEKEE